MIWRGTMRRSRNAKIVATVGPHQSSPGGSCEPPVMLNWSVKEFADRSGLSCAVIRRLEEYNDTPPASDELLQTL
ncbi:hypothetical protein XH96_34025 [Bradyrhizobium sp. CCBAU 51765]|uniref:Uncharacterized protein n=2 Tax=Bradyrhizobium TaxID=374 RepID=A0AAE7TEW5_9BRAD|nr:hypothetical protein XH96_34025 [Bradyrhizobium sp. CCBAU 51765]QOZ66532.1 hypothetical protein WN72_09205 [Bradyrhizobium arachidis]